MRGPCVELLFKIYQICQNSVSGCVKVEVDVLGAPSLIVRTVSVDVK